MARAATKRGTRGPGLGVADSRLLRSGGVIAIGGAVDKPARWRPPDRRARRAPLRSEGHGHAALRRWKVVFFVAAASSPSEGPSTSRHADVRPTDALGARRYEERTRNVLRRHLAWYVALACAGMTSNHPARAPTFRGGLRGLCRGSWCRRIRRRRPSAGRGRCG